MFERVTCTRCGGSGRYSWCQMYGDRCFKCGGSGKQLTPRGKAAALYLKGLKTRKAADVQLGDCIRYDGVPGFSRTTYFRVETIHTELPGAQYGNHKSLCFTGKCPKGESYSISCAPSHDVVLVFTKAQNEALLQQALEYQATLTKAGTPRKR